MVKQEAGSGAHVGTLDRREADERERAPVTGSCLVCGGSDGPVVMREHGYVGRACDCGIVYIDPAPDPATIDPTVDLHLESYYALPAKARLRWIQRFVGDGRLLDIGCGTGSLAAEALEAGYTVSAVEPNPASAAIVRRRHGIEVEESLIEDSALAPGSVDVSFHVDLLSHFPDPVGALRAIADKTSPDGVICFEVGLFAGLDPRWYPWVGRPRFPAHRTFFSEDGLRAVLDDAGLELIDIRAYSVAPSTVLSSLLRRMLPDDLEAVPVEEGRPPARGSARHRAYARLHHVLRYRLGAVLPVPGPKTAFVAARRKGDDPRPGVGRRRVQRPSLARPRRDRRPRAVIVVNVLPRWISDFNEVSTALIDAGFDVEVHTSAPDPEADTGWRSARELERAKAQLAPGVEVKLLPYSNLRVGPIALVRTIARSARCAFGDPDALFVLWTGIPTLTWGPALRLLRRRVVYMITGLSPVRSPARQSRALKAAVTRIDKRLLTTERCRVLVHNVDDKAFLDTSYDLPPDRVVVTPGCGVSPEEFPFSDPAPAPHRPIILVPVRLLVDKGVLDAAAASVLLDADGIDHEMWFTSSLDPTHPTALSRSDVDRLAAATPSARFLGYQGSLVERYAACDIACVPTYFPEGLPTALLEAASSGRPIVTTDNVGGRDFVRDGVDGLVVPPRDPRALADAIARLIADPAAADRMRRSAHARFLAAYTKQHMVEVTLDTFRALGVDVPGGEASARC